MGFLAYWFLSFLASWFQSFGDSKNRWLFRGKILIPYYRMSTSCFWVVLDIVPISPNLHFMFFGRYWSHITKVMFHVFVDRYWAHIQAFQKQIDGASWCFVACSSRGLETISDILRLPKIRFWNGVGFFLEYLWYPGVSKDKSYWLWESWKRPEIPKSWTWSGFLSFQ